MSPGTKPSWPLGVVASRACLNSRERALSGPEGLVSVGWKREALHHFARKLDIK